MKVAPYLWSPRFFLYVSDKVQDRPFYRPTGSPKRVAVFEPNLNVVKTATMPIVIAELLHREEPGLIGKVYVTNSGWLAKKRDFIRFVQSSVSLYTDQRMFFEKRYRFAWFLSAHTDIVLSHQWDNELNYLFIEALFAGFPLVHNSPYFKDCGYYYEGDDGYMGKEKLREAILTHDDNIDEYNKKVRRRGGGGGRWWRERQRPREGVCVSEFGEWGCEFHTQTHTQTQTDTLTQPLFVSAPIPPRHFATWRPVSACGDTAPSTQPTSTSGTGCWTG